MEDDLKNEGYRLIYIFTFVLVFCIIPALYILLNTELNRKEAAVFCENQLEIKEQLSEGKDGDIYKYKYRLTDETEYTSTLKYNPGSKVCRY